MTHTSLPQDVLEAVDTPWDYMVIGDDPPDADCLLVLGSYDIKVAEFASALCEERSYSYVVISGGVAHESDTLATGWDEPEALVFLRRMIELGTTTVPLILEPTAQNTSDNLMRTRALLEHAGLSPDSVLLCTKPYMERRALATAQIEWAGPTLAAASFPEPARAYLDRTGDPQRDINALVGDLDRILKYPARGWQVAQEVPERVMSSFEFLVASGYRDHLLTV